MKEHPLDGESFVDAMLDPDAERQRGPVFYLFPGYLDKRAQPSATVIDEINGQRYKLYYTYEANTWELYNLTEDIAEETNLIEEQPEVAATLSKMLNAWLTKDEPTWNPKYPIVRKTGKSAGPPPLLGEK